MKVKRIPGTLFIGIAIVFGLTGCGVGEEGLAGPAGQQENAPVTGNGAPSGSHFQMNLIGVSNPKDVSNSNNGARIFVPLFGSCKILLTEGPFQVLDFNGTDGTAAFQLPNPDPTGTGTFTYNVFARALGKPGGSSVTTTCATDPTTGEVVCSISSMTLTRKAGKSNFTNVSKEL